MQLILQTWNGHNINDGTTYESWIPVGQLVNLRARGITAPRATNFPYLSGMVLQEHFFTIGVKIAPNASIPTNREVLKSWFDITDKTRHTLVAKDILDSDRQWYLTGFPAQVVENNPGIYTVTLQVEMPVWRTVLTITDNWSITASGQTDNVSNIGNIRCAPTYTFTPTTANPNRLQFRRWIPITNNLQTGFTIPLEITNGGVDTAVLVSDNSVSNQINVGGGINNAVTSWAIDTPLGGGLPTGGGMFYMDSEQCTYTSIAAGTISGVTRGVNGTTAASHLDNTTMRISRMQADGDDLLVWMDGSFQDRWLYGMNTASTKCWINLPLSPGQAGTTAVSIASSGAITTITFTQTSANKRFLEAVAKAINKVVLIDQEAFTFTGVNLMLWQLTGVTRAMKGTVMAAHAAPSTAIWVEHDLFLVYGDRTLSAPQVDDRYKPILDLSSTNLSWSFTNFYDSLSARSAAWRGERLASKTGLSGIFTGNENSQANPSTELGLALVGTNSEFSVFASVGETGTLQWMLFHPAGITDVIYSGKKYSVDLNVWPAVAGLQVLQDNNANWATKYTEAMPLTALAWEPFGPRNVSLGGTYTTVRFAMDGTINPIVNNLAMIQFDTVTLAIDNTYLPSITLRPVESINFFDLRLTNNTTGEFIELETPVLVNGTVTVDCENKKAYTNESGRVNVWRSTSRESWLDLEDGSNELLFTDAGTVAVSEVTSFRARTI